MANSLGFLDKPNTTATQIGPQPKPATPTPAKSTFLDPSNPWRVGTSTPTTALTTKKSTTSKPRQSNASAPVPTRGYNYTESGTASGQPAYVRQREVDQATMSGQAAGQRRKSQRDAAAEAAARQAAQRPAVPQVQAAAPMGMVTPITSWTPVQTAAGVIQNTTSPAMKALSRYIEAVTGEHLPQMPTSPAINTTQVAQAAQQAGNWPPQPFQMPDFSPAQGDPWLTALGYPADWQAQEAARQGPVSDPWLTALGYPADWQAQEAARQGPMSDPFLDALHAAQAAQRASATGKQPAQPVPPVATPAAPTPAQMEFQRRAAEQQRQAAGLSAPTVNGMAPPLTIGSPLAAQQAATTAGATPVGNTGAVASTSPEAWRASHAIDEDGNYLSYGWKVPGAITVEKNVDLQRSQVRQPWQIRYNQPAWTEIGMRYRMSDEMLAAETAQRQRMAGQPIRPWASYTDAEKYQLRYGVAPQGEQARRPTSGEDALAAADAQHWRLVNDYRAKNWDVRAGRPKWPGWGEEGPIVYPSDAAVARYEAAQAGKAPPATQQAVQAAATQMQDAGTDFAENDQLLAAQNPQGVLEGKITDADLDAVARRIAQRYRPDMNVSGMTAAEIYTLLAMTWEAPAGMEQQMAADLTWLGRFFAEQ